MKYKNGKSWYDTTSQEWKYQPRIYTNFYCSLQEWANLGRGKENFMYQVRSAIVDLFDIEPSKLPIYDDKKHNGGSEIIGYTSKITLHNGLVLNKLSFNRCGIQDGLEGEQYSADIVKHAIKLITNRDAEVEFYSWKGTIDHIEITFPNLRMPNIILLLDIPSGDNSTNDILIKCINAIYDVLNAKTTQWYDKYLHLYFNNDFDMIFYGGISDSNGYHYGHYSKWANKWEWKDRIFPKTKRTYNDYANIKISYK